MNYQTMNIKKNKTKKKLICPIRLNYLKFLSSKGLEKQF